jgi:hypothetical protein
VLFERVHGDAPMCDHLTTPADVEWKKFDPELVSLLEQVSRLPRDQLKSTLKEVQAGTVLEFLKQAKLAPVVPKSPLLDVVRADSSRYCCGSVGIMTEDPLENPNDCEEVAVKLAMIEGWDDSKLLAPIPGQPCKTQRYVRLMSGKREKVGFTEEVERTIIPCRVNVPLSKVESKYRSMANSCGIALMWQRKFVWKDLGLDDRVLVVVYVGESLLNMADLPAERPSDKKALCALLTKDGWRMKGEDATTASLIPPPEIGPCFVVASVGGKLHKRVTQKVLHLLRAYDAPIEVHGKIVDLRGVIGCSWTQSVRGDILNPALYDALMSAREDAEIISLAGIGMEWKKEGEQLEMLAKRFTELKRLDLSDNRFWEDLLCLLFFQSCFMSASGALSLKNG